MGAGPMTSPSPAAPAAEHVSASRTALVTSIAHLECAASASSLTVARDESARALNWLRSILYDAAIATPPAAPAPAPSLADAARLLLFALDRHVHCPTWERTPEPSYVRHLLPGGVAVPPESCPACALRSALSAESERRKATLAELDVVLAHLDEEMGCGSGQEWATGPAGGVESARAALLRAKETSR